MSTSVRFINRKSSQTKTKINNIEVGSKQLHSTHLEKHKDDTLLYKLTRFILPPILVDRIEVGDLYIRKRGNKKEFVRIVKRSTESNREMDCREAYIVRKKEMLLRTLRSLQEERKRAVQHEEERKRRLRCEEDDLYIKRQLEEAYRKKEKLLKERKEREEYDRRQRLGIRESQPYHLRFPDAEQRSKSTVHQIVEDRSPHTYMQRRRSVRIESDYESESDDSDDSDSSLDVCFLQHRNEHHHGIPYAYRSMHRSSPHNFCWCNTTKPDHERCHRSCCTYEDSGHCERQHRKRKEQPKYRRGRGSLLDPGLVHIQTRDPDDYW